MIHIATPDGELRILNDDYDFGRLIEEYAGYEAIANKNGVRLGVKPDEFDFLDREEKERNDKRKMVVQQNHRRELGQ